jgi:hypothetical protein
VPSSHLGARGKVKNGPQWCQYYDHWFGRFSPSSGQKIADFLVTIIFSYLHQGLCFESNSLFFDKNISKIIALNSAIFVSDWVSHRVGSFIPGYEASYPGMKVFYPGRKLLCLHFMTWVLNFIPGCKTECEKQTCGFLRYMYIEMMLFVT